MNRRRKTQIKMMLALLLITFFSIGISPKSVDGREMAYRHFFQTTSTYDDGAMTRWTGCVNIGGQCWSESSTVADCSLDGGQTWVNCNRPPSIDPGF